jgi:drug/metabolite transporter (DMT)-like permease
VAGSAAGSVEGVRRVAPADLMLLVTVLLWGFNFTVTKYVLTHGFQPLAYSVIRYGGAALLFAGLTFRLEGGLSVSRRDVPLLVVAAGLGILLNQLAYMYAVKLTTASTVALILGTTPIFTALIARAFGLERLSRRFWAASVVSFGGAALVAVGSGGGISGDVLGDVLAVATAATWAAYSVVVAPLMRSYSPFRISAVVLLVGWVPLAAAGAGQVADQDYSLDPLVWISLAYALLGPLVLTNLLWFTAIDRVGPSRATLFANLQPFVAALFALLVLSERITWLQVVGGIAIGLGIALSRVRRRPARVEAPAAPAEEAVPATRLAAR